MIVVIPTLNLNHLNDFFSDIENVDLDSVDRFFVFNNSVKKWNSSNSKIHVINLGKNMGVNYVWNQGLQIALQKNMDLMLINDDIVFKPNFFKKTQEALDKLKSPVIVCPKTTNQFFKFDNAVFKGRNKYSKLYKRQGWAFTISRDTIPLIKRIPEELNIFFGDDWIFHFTKNLWVIDHSNVVFHFVGKTMATNPEKRRLLEYERQIFKEKIKGLENIE